MRKTNWLPMIRNILIAMMFFVVGRVLVLWLGNLGIVLVLVGVIVFYAVWWSNYQKNKRKS